MSSAVKIVSACVDTLVLNVYPTDGSYQIERHDLPEGLKVELELLKKLSQDQEEPIPSRFAFQRANLKMTPKGSEGFNWILKNSLISVAVNRSSKMSLWAQVRCSSQYLQTTRDLGKVICDVHIFLTTIFGQLITLQPSSLDLAVDVAFLDLGAIHDVKEHFVTRAQLTGQLPADINEMMIDGPDAIKQRWGRLTGLPFGARTAALSALIYDKTHEIKYHSPEKTWQGDIWEQEAEKQGFCLLKNTQVWRNEIRFKRQAINEMKQEGSFHGINDAYDLEAHLPGLWAYAVGHVGGGADGLPDGWLRYVISSQDENRSRWPVHPDWEVIQSAFAPVSLEESDYEQEQREREEILQDLDTYLALHPLSPVRKVLHPFESFQPSALVAPLESDTIDLSDISPSSAAPQSDTSRAGVSLPAYARERKRNVNMRRMVAQIAGCIITAEAWRRRPAAADSTVEPDISDTMHFIYSAVQSYLSEKQRDFSEDVHKKRVLYDLEETLARLDDASADDNEVSA